MAELAVVDEVDAGLFLLLDGIDHSALELTLEGGLVDLVAGDALVVELDHFRRARQAPHVGGLDPVGHPCPSL